MILDTDVLIWLMRKNVNAIALVASVQQREIAQATWLELVEGVRNKRELAEMQSLLVDLSIRTLPLTESIGQRAGILMGTSKNSFFSKLEPFGPSRIDFISPKLPGIIKSMLPDPHDSNFGKR